MSYLSKAQIDRILCNLMGYKDFELQQDGKEITFTLDLEVMDRFNDFCYVSSKMFKEAAAGKDLRKISFDLPESPRAENQHGIDAPFDPLGKVYVDRSLEHLLKAAGYEIKNIPTANCMPVLTKGVKEFEAQEKEAISVKSQNVRQARDELKKAKKAGDESAIADLSAKIEALEATPAMEKTFSESINEYRKNVIDPKHRYKDHNIYVRILKGWENTDLSSVYLTLRMIRDHLYLKENGITDVMQDVIVYEWFAKLSEHKRSLYPEEVNLDRFYRGMRLTNVIIYPDGKAILWYTLLDRVLGDDILGIGVDIDPPFEEGYATGIKHVHIGSLSDHPSLMMYRNLYNRLDLSQMVKAVHYCSDDNISPFSLEETSSQLIFINDPYVVFDVELPLAKSDKKKVIEVMFKSSNDFDLDKTIKRLAELKENELSDFDSLMADMMEGVAEPVIEIKNEQEAKRRRRDPELEGLTFVDPMHHTDFTRNKFEKNYPLNVERAVICDEGEIKFVMPTPLFSYHDKADEIADNDDDTLNLIHADAIVVTLSRVAEQYEFTSIDLADCVQIPTGNHHNKEVERLKLNTINEILDDHSTPEANWIEKWESDYDVVVKERELKNAAAKAKKPKKGKKQ